MSRSDVESSLAVLDRVLSEFDDIETDSFFSGDGESPAAAADALAELEADGAGRRTSPPPVDRSTKPRSASAAATPAASWRSSRSDANTARSSVGNRAERGAQSPSPGPDTPTSTLNGSVSTMRSTASTAATETGTGQRGTGSRPLRQASVESRLRPSRPAPSPPIQRQASAPSGSLSSRHSDASATAGGRGSHSFRAAPTGSEERRGRGLRRSDEPPAPTRSVAADDRVLERGEDGATVGEVTFELDGGGRTFNYVSYRDGGDGSGPAMGPMSLPGSLAMEQPDSPPTNSYPKKMPLFSPIVKDRLNDNTNMYIPAPPSPRPDYYDSELSETDSLAREGSDTEALFGLQEKQKGGKKKTSGGRFGATKTSPPMHRKNKVKESKERHQKKKTPEKDAPAAEAKTDSKGRGKTSVVTTPTREAMIEDFHRNLPPPPAFDDADALNVSMDEPPSLAEEVEMEPDDSYYSDDSLDYQDGRSKGAAKRRRRRKSDWSTTTSFDFVHRKEARKRIPEKLTNRDEEGVQVNPLTHARPGPPLSPLATFHSAESLHSSLPPVLRASGGKGANRGHLTLPGERGLERRDVRRADSLAVSKKEKDGDSKFKFSIFKGFWRRKQYSLEQV
ncbi:hypothetical protein FJT64_008745 [Amphibalanus amphitrite]|uniref:Uncharacterized protein n=1 Tax=Amphibalanus amphitrite TaxID=1232801 RepID=A0A6A4VU49_AMPAM|nr:hypothetical protein FJT64_008745 [Amphibalanus amphitrite]